MEAIRERYDNLDGLRVISCFCIIAMHIKANTEYQMTDPVYTHIIGGWGHFVALFLMISGFSMFCGYYERFKNGSMSLTEFYTRRYSKILPFFITLILLDIVLDRSLEHVFEGLIEVTMVFGLLPNNQLDVIGVSWTLGVIFLFYMLFPFFVYLCRSKISTVITLAVSIVISLLCSVYFFSDKFVTADFTPRHNILYCAPWILAGGFVYVFRKEITGFVSKFRWVWLAVCVLLDVAWHFTPGEIAGVDIWMIKNLLLYMPWLMYAISVKSYVLSNKFMKYLCGISLELYLAQMVIFRAVEKVHCLYLLGNGWFSFILVWIVVVLGLVGFIIGWKKVWEFTSTKVKSLLAKSPK